MKSIFKLSILAVFIALPSCKNYLDVQPQGKVIPKTDEEFAAIMHNRINEIEGGEDQYVIGNVEGIIMYEGFAENLDANVKVGEIPAYAGDKINNRQSDYKSIFAIIRDCNIVIENLGGRDSELALKAVSAAYAMKGICYYNLIRDWCDPYEDGNAANQMGIPLIDHLDMEEMPARASLKETVEYTVDLMRKSMSYHISDGFFLFTENIVKAYLAKLYFWVGDWSSAAVLCEEIMAVPGYRLATIAEYPTMIQAKYDKLQEVIVRSHINNNSNIDWYFASIIKNLKTRPVNVTLTRLFASDKENDVRYAVSYDAKRINVKSVDARLRSSEIVLMLAECYAHQGKEEAALAQLNLLRRNRITGVADYTLATLPEIDASALIKQDAEGKPLTKLLSAIFDERRKELYMEGDRWFELKRNGRPEFWIINSGLKYTTKKYLYTAPIYKSDVDLNPNITQNEGYVS